VTFLAFSKRYRTTRSNCTAQCSSTQLDTIGHHERAGLEHQVFVWSVLHAVCLACSQNLHAILLSH